MSGQTGYYNNMAMCGKAGTCTDADIEAFEISRIPDVTPTKPPVEKVNSDTVRAIVFVVVFILLGFFGVYLLRHKK